VVLLQVGALRTRASTQLLNTSPGAEHTAADERRLRGAARHRREARCGRAGRPGRRVVAAAEQLVRDAVAAPTSTALAVFASARWR
jgi:hypothetical protein